MRRRGRDRHDIGRAHRRGDVDHAIVETVEQLAIVPGAISTILRDVRINVSRWRDIGEGRSLKHIKPIFAADRRIGAIVFGRPRKDRAHRTRKSRARDALPAPYRKQLPRTPPHQVGIPEAPLGLQRRRRLHNTRRDVQWCERHQATSFSISAEAYFSTSSTRRVQPRPKVSNVGRLRRNASRASVYAETKASAPCSEQ